MFKKYRKRMKQIQTNLKQIFLTITALLALTIFLTPAVTATVAAQTSKSDQAACDNANTQAKIQQCLKKNPISEKLRMLVNFLSAGVGVVVVAMIIVGGIQYIMAGDNPNAISEAKNRITNALIALVAFLFVAAFLQWLVPGGLFNPS